MTEKAAEPMLSNLVSQILCTKETWNNLIDMSVARWKSIVIPLLNQYTQCLFLSDGEKLLGLVSCLGLC